jgi:hypothetical protein
MASVSNRVSEGITMVAVFEKYSMETVLTSGEMEAPVNE